MLCDLGSMTELIRLVGEHELLLLFIVVFLGLLLGRVEYKGVHLGVAGVLFAGLGLSALVADPTRPLKLAPQLRDLGLVLFVYCVGLTSGPGFFSAFRSGAVRFNVAIAGALLVGAALTLIGGRLLNLDGGHIAGVFSGALTNTPALAAAGDRLKGTPTALHPTLGYSVTYPFGVLGALLLFRFYAVMRKRALDEERAKHAALTESSLRSANFEITNPSIVGKAIGELRVRDAVGVVISRLRRQADLIVPTKYTYLSQGDIVTAVGRGQALEAAVPFFGKPSHEQLEVQRGPVDTRRVLVSRRDLVGMKLSDLDLDVKYNAQVTRLRRADLDLLPSPDMRLELGDRLRVVAPVERVAEVSKFFGDSERALADIDFTSFALGLSLGLVLARIPIPIPGGELKLGIAGGPLLVALVLGRLGRSGRFLWSITYEANTALRGLGLLLFLAGVGVSAGAQFTSVLGGLGLSMFALGAVVTLVTTILGMVVLRRYARAGVISTLGACSGMQTQPATLAAAHELSGRSEDTYVAYAMVYPVAMIGKILLAQLLVVLG